MTDIFATLEATWPPATAENTGPWRLRDGAGGGKRVSAASALGPITEADVQALEDDARKRGLAALVQVKDSEAELDALLDAQGYTVVDPTWLWAMPVAGLTDIPLPKVTAFAVWEPLAIMTDIWRKTGLPPARFAVMARAAHKTAIFSRCNDKPAGVAFAAIHGDMCMVHAVEVLPHQRRQGMAQWMMRKAAFWAQEQGATTLSVACVAANDPANALYEGLGFERAGGYHYRTKEIAT